MAARVAGTGMGSRGREVSSGAAGDDDGRGPNNRLVDMLSCFGGAGGVSPPACRQSSRTRGRQWLRPWG